MVEIGSLWGVKLVSVLFRTAILCNRGDPNGHPKDEIYPEPGFLQAQDYLVLVHSDQAGEDLALHPYYRREWRE